ncbi:hypothetical protein GQ457_09G025820 [Hibiscus cannabinus]
MRFMYCVAVILRRGDLQNRYDAAVTLRCGRILILWYVVNTVLSRRHGITSRRRPLESECVESKIFETNYRA